MKPEWLKFPPVADIFEQAAAFAAEDCCSTLTEWHLALSLLRFGSVRKLFPQAESLQNALFEAAEKSSDGQGGELILPAMPEQFRTLLFAAAERLRERDRVPLPQPNHFLAALREIGSDNFRTVLQKYSGRRQRRRYGNVPKRPPAPTSRRRTLEENLKRAPAGQDAVPPMLCRRNNERESGRRSRGVRKAFLFTGPAGSGRTEAARRLARQLAVPLVRFDLATCTDPAGKARLFGQEPGSASGSASGLLITAIRETPRCVLVLHRVESASSAVHRELLRVLESGSLTDRFGRRADFRQVCLILEETSPAESGPQGNFPAKLRSLLTDTVKFPLLPTGNQSNPHFTRSIQS